MSYYVHSNAEIIAMMAERHKIEGDLFWMKLDREHRTMTNELNGKVYEIPESVVLT